MLKPNQIELKVTLTFSDEIPNEGSRHEVTENLINALNIHRECSESGLAGDEMDGYTIGIEVSSSVLTMKWDEKNGIITV